MQGLHVDTILKPVLVSSLRRTVQALAVLYPLSLLGVAAALRNVGEAWWITTVGLYLPRILFAAPLPFIAIALRLLGMRRLLWAQALSGFLIVFPLMGFVLPWPTFRNRDAASLRVLSFNINAAYGGTAALLEQIDKYSPDVVLLQEVGEVDELSRLLRSRYPTVNVSSQFIVATRYPVLSTIYPDKLPYRGRLRSPRFVEQVLETPLGRIAFYNVHPLSPRAALFALRGEHGLKREIVSGRLFSGADGPGLDENTGLRALQVQALAEAARREADPVVIAGDTNLPGLSGILHRYLAQYKDGFVEASWGFGYTFPTNKWRPWMRIDRVLATDQLRFVGFDVGHSLASDHRCVVADLQRRDR
jgi:endonuclease/exonuclease/phosphatase (EEP) superfamily protein YafD